MKSNEYALQFVIWYWAYVWTVSILEYLDLPEISTLEIQVLVHLSVWQIIHTLGASYKIRAIKSILVLSEVLNITQRDLHLDRPCGFQTAMCYLPLFPVY